MPIIRKRICSFLSESIKLNEFSHTIIHNVNILDNDYNINNLKNVNGKLPSNNQYN